MIADDIDFHLRYNVHALFKIYVILNGIKTNDSRQNIKIKF